MSRRRPTAKPQSTVTDTLIADVFRDPAYLESLKARLIAGTARASEVQIARELGLVIPQTDPDSDARAGLTAMDREALRVLVELTRRAHRASTSPRLRVIRAGTITGLGYDTSTDAVAVVPRSIIEPTAVPQTDDELLPPRTAP